MRCTLEAEGFRCRITRVATEEEFRAELTRGQIDVILADCSLPGFDGMAALRIAESMVPDIPFILLSGSLAEELAVALLKNGATDYLWKDRLSRLGPSVTRAIREAEQARAQKAAQAALQDSQERLSLALRASGIGVWSMDPVSERFDCDERMSELIGVAPDDLPLDRESFLARVHEEDRDAVELFIRDAQERVSDFQFEYRVAASDDAIRHISTRGRFLSVDGTSLRAIGACWDVTSEKQEEQQRRLLSTVLESAVNAIMITDAEGRITWVNAAFAELTGYALDEVRGENPRILNSGKHDDKFYREMWETISQGNTWHGQLVNRRKDGALYTEETTIMPVRGDYGEIVSFVCMKRDITLAVDLTRQLQQAQRLEAVGRLAGGVAHDFNNMLTIISGNAGLALAEVADETPVAMSLKEILEAAKRAAGLTRQLLAFSRKQVLKPKVIDLNTLVVGTEKMLRRLIGEDIELASRLDPALGAIEADPGQLEQILMNLAVNARDAMPRGGELTFETENAEIHQTYAGIGGVPVHSGKYVKLTVTDTGEGMDEETQARIFEPFFTTKEQGKGTGLGLSTVYGIVKQSGGFIWSRSEPGKGTSFEVFFPQTDTTPEDPWTENAPALASGVETVLLVEDDVQVLKLARSILERSSYNVLAAASGAEALGIAREYPKEIHLLVTDVVMPGMSGRQLSDSLHGIRPETPVLYTSGYTDDAIVHHGVLDAGVNLLEKPYTQNELLVAVRSALNQPLGAPAKA